MAIIDWEAARRRDGYGPKPAGATLNATGAAPCRKPWRLGTP